MIYTILEQHFPPVPVVIVVYVTIAWVWHPLHPFRYSGRSTDTIPSVPSYCVDAPSKSQNTVLLPEGKHQA